MSRLAFGFDLAVAEWVAARIPHVQSFGECHAVGVVGDDAVLAGCVYHHWHDGGCEISFAAEDPRWAGRGVITALLAVPFQQWGLRRVTMITPHDMEARVMRLPRRLGFVREGVLRDLYGRRRHGAVYGLLRRDFEAGLFRRHTTRKAA